MKPKELSAPAPEYAALAHVLGEHAVPLAFGTAGDVRESLKAHLSDPRVADPRVCLSVADFVLAQRVAMVESGESKQLIEALADTVNTLADDAASISDDEQREAINRSIRDLRDTLAARKQHHSALDQLAKSNRDAMAAREAASRIETSRGAVIGRTHAAAVAIEVSDLMRRAFEMVSDPAEAEKIKAFVRNEMARLSQRFADE